MANPDDVHVSIRLQSPARPLQPRALHRASIRGVEVPERSFLPLGTVDSGVLAHVDDAGVVQLQDATWCLEWWIGAEDRWHHPARETAVRQRCIDSSPVVETVLRVPGGDVLARTYGVQATAGDWRGPGVVLEVENRTAVPVGLAFVIRPVALDGPGSVRTVSSSDADVLVDGDGHVLLSKTASRVVVGRRGEVAELLARGDDASGPVDVTGSEGDVEVAFVLPLTHTAVARVLLPVPSAALSPRRRGPTPTAPWSAPDADPVARGWSTHVSDDLRLVVPEPGWGDGLRWAAAMLRLAGADEVGACLDRERRRPAGPPAAVRAAEVAEAMARVGAADALAPIARGLAQAQRLGGEVRLGDRSDGTVALLHAVGGALAGHTDGDSDLVADLLAPAAVAVRRIRKGRGFTEELRTSAGRALRMLVPTLRAIGQPDVAEDAAAVAASLAQPASASSSRRPPTATGGPDRPGRSDRSDGSDDVGRSTVTAALAAREAVALGAGADAVAGVRACWTGVSSRGRSDLELVRDDGSSTVPVGSLGFDAAELAARTNAMLDVFVRDGFASDAAQGPLLLSSYDPSWYGQVVEAHGVASPWGPVGVAVRWHGARPALLWQVGDSDGDGIDEAGDTVVVAAPGLDVAWRGVGSTGDALLAAPPLGE